MILCNHFHQSYCIKILQVLQHERCIVISVITNINHMKDLIIRLQRSGTNGTVLQSNLCLSSIPTNVSYDCHRDKLALCKNPRHKGIIIHCHSLQRETSFRLQRMLSAIYIYLSAISRMHEVMNLAS